MSPARRRLLKSLAGGGLLAAGLSATRVARVSEAAGSSPEARRGPLSVLVLGGTGFLGPAIAEPALARGHRVTLFNRGKTNPGLFPSAEHLHGDRDPEKGGGLKSLDGRRFDVVFDTSGYYPRMVGASARLLATAGSTQYVFVSTESVYRDLREVGIDEDYPLAALSNRDVESMGSDFENYGALKALCESEVTGAFGERATIVRPGYIVGPNDPTGRFTWYPVRASRGGEMLAPGHPSDPVQIIDVRDLGEWMLTLAEEHIFGVFNAHGPRGRLNMGRMLEECVAQSGRKASLMWVPASFLRTLADASVPIWEDPRGATRGAHRLSNRRAVRAGLTTRPLSRTVADTLAWYEALSEDARSGIRLAFSEEQERQVLAAWHARGR